MNEQKCHCQRCGVKVKFDPITNSNARMVRRSKVPKGLCINCAVHDELKHLYPANLLLASSGPRCLALPHIQEQFSVILKSADSDADPSEISWDIVIENWDLPFPIKLKRTAMNPAENAWNMSMHNQVIIGGPAFEPDEISGDFVPGAYRPGKGKK